MKVARDLQTRAIEQVVYVPFGQWTQPIAYRADRIDGIVPNTGLAGVLEHRQEVGPRRPSCTARARWDRRWAPTCCAGCWRRSR